MPSDKEIIRVRGQSTEANSYRFNGNAIVVTGTFVRVAKIKEEWYEDVLDPDKLTKNIKDANIDADMFTFIQRLPDITPKYSYYMEQDNIAALELKTYDDWWKKDIPKQTRNHVRRAEKAGVVVKVVNFDEEFIRGIWGIYNESPLRQGKPFWHYGKDLASLKAIHETFPGRSDFIGAYYGGELIGFIKLVYAGETARTLHIIAKSMHRDKAPTNALIAKAVEICCEKRVPYLVYGNYDYGNKGSDGLTLFKKENGFKKVYIPRYYIPLSLKGKMVLKLRLHHGVLAYVPRSVMRSLLYVRRYWYTLRYKES